MNLLFKINLLSKINLFALEILYFIFPSKWEAIKAQFITAIAAFLGTFLGLYAGKNEFLEKIMLATTAGGFIYIATVGILPAVINEKSSLHEIFLECVGFSVGIGFMVVVAYLEVIDEINV